MFNIGFIPASPDEQEEARKQRIANLTDKYPDLATLMNGLTWKEIYNLPMARQKDE